MPRPLPKRYLAIVALLLVATNAHAQQGPQLENWPEWVQEAMQTESRRMKFRKVVTSDESLHIKLPGKPEVPEAFDGGWYFASDIKANSPLECYIWNQSMDLATLANFLAESNIEALANTHGAVTERQVFHTESGAIASMPYLALEWMYVVQAEPQPLAAFTKVRVATKGDVSFGCAHNYLGYRETFAKAFAEFVTTAEYEDATATPYYEEIAQLEMNGVGTGIAYTSYTADAEGDIKVYYVDSSLVAVDPSTVVATDSYTITYSMDDGELINAYSINVENGEISSDLSLERDDAGTWIVSGTTQGKSLNREIDASLSPASELRQLEIARNLFAGDKTTDNALVWVPSIDPTRLLETTITRDDAEVERQAVLVLGPVSYTGRFDEDGNMVESDMQIGPVTINIRRIWSAGSLSR